MKTIRSTPLVLCLSALLLSPAVSRAFTFTGDALISPYDASFDGLDIIVSNCTLTVDGPHSFASLQVLSGGVVTHTFAPNGTLPVSTFTVIGEQHVLSATNIAWLNYSNIVYSSIVVKDLSGYVYTQGVDYQVVISTGRMGLQLLSGSAIPEGSVNQVNYQYTGPTVPSGLTLTISNNLVIQAGGSINADRIGYGGGMGPGHGNPSITTTAGGGAGYGGNGGAGASVGGMGPVYGSLQQPTDKGSGGGGSPGAAGGGAIKLVVGGALLVDGSISANGANAAVSRAGGGSGGSIWLVCQTFAGSGVISANGGSGDLPSGGGGGGGRIALQSVANVFTGQFLAIGGNGYAFGGAGTVYFTTGNAPGQVLVDNGGNRGLTTFLQSSQGFDLTAQGGALLSMQGVNRVGNLLLRSNSWLLMTNRTSLEFTVTSNATIQAGSGITADSAGFAANQGQGAGRNYSYPMNTAGGGGYGGNGGSGASVSAYGGAGGYGSLTEPNSLGSGGGDYVSTGLGSAGGGAIRLTVTGTLVVNGRISADGGAGIADGSGGGSGGSIWLTVGTLAGAGVISANGGAGSGFGVYAGGGGGGGRIALSSAANLFFGMMTARGGPGYGIGGAGTIYTTSRFQNTPQVLVDNGGQRGTNTFLTGLGNPLLDLSIQNGAVVSFFNGPYFRNVLVGSNAWVVLTNVVLNLSGNLTVLQGGFITADGKGFGPGLGLGAGKFNTSSGGGYTGGGGGYGGYGGDGIGSTSTLHTGGNIYGSVTAPVDTGSGGGGPSSNYGYPGGSGGGVIRLSILGNLDVDGTLSANGNDANLAGGGGGSGGALWLTVGTLSGTGLISANGGDGIGLGGGGGGGRIAIQCGSNFFSGSLMAQGGAGPNPGGAGTIYTKVNNQAYGLLLIDNGGRPGTNTSWLQASTMDLTVSGGAVVAPPSTQTFGNLVVGPNGVLLLSNQTLTVNGNATIQPGGRVTADATGYGPGQGPGAGRTGDSPYGTASGGGGYGGNGGNGNIGLNGPVGGNTFSSGGNTYGSLTSPIDRGSGGGGISTYNGLGGAGGGAIHLSVNGTLTVAGSISANGGSGAMTGGGGGSGGSIWLSVGTLTGSGIISANGGDGNPQTGGGGGGRISIQPGTSTFDGLLTAYGGGGYAFGGAGTIFLSGKSPVYRTAQLIVDNGGNLGTNTSWALSGTFDLIVRGGGIAAPPAQTFNSLLIASNSWLRLSNQTQFTITSNATVQAGGGIIADGTGYGSGQGFGAGRVTNVPSIGYIAGGGGYGGCGAPGGQGALAPGGASFGTPTAPTSLGSGGGSNPSTYGGAGGGVIRLNVLGIMSVDGRVSADGAPGTIPGAGGGSGGSVWLTVGSLTGAGRISANGGSGNALGGGGGGGRVALQYASSTFSGPITAWGGGGGNWGGAGTIYLKPNNQPNGQLLVDNGGHFGTNTIISSQTSPFDLTVKNGAGVLVSGPSLLLSNLDIGPGGQLGMVPGSNTFALTVLRDALIEAEGTLSLDGRGYAGMTGPGRGTNLNSVGSGAGYGGKGGASSLQQGGPAYGSALQPVDPGSSGGFGYGIWAGGSEGGGALRLSVGRVLSVNGVVSANGNPGLQEDSGGGSGGSLWLSAAYLVGNGQVLAEGGAGELYNGGGGGGGRIAIYSPANLFAGLVSAAGAEGFSRGQDGTVYYSATLSPPIPMGQSPAGTVTYAVDSIDVTFDTALDPYSALSSDVTVTTPNGPLAPADIAVAATGPATVRISFPPQTAEGVYSFSFGSQLQSLFGQKLADPYSGAFGIAWPVIQGKVVDGKNQPVAGVALQPDGGLACAHTDATGSYALKVIPSGSVRIVPSLNNLVFVPGSQSYPCVTAQLESQNYLAVESIAPQPALRRDANGMVMSWQSVPGVTYQALSSTNLVDWVPYGEPVVATGGALEVPLNYGDAPQLFFRLQATN